ncbi:hypothetical protein M2103_000067 [Ereboglobus sp. PH5-5]|uniref:hypothetical protein n=1 Tax=unclassified Ereboglobus TaxID=2626932 RepID=UPI002404EFF1|nr:MULTISPECIES: hypothetical protein [unclassified Ereboglobus]MDF9826816.1 hypothetical protein [Ereboglobus sp. PH5-10]MDF9831863.1 hypothetical protein [Ereboglobus sp. PH5-5]
MKLKGPKLPLIIVCFLTCAAAQCASVTLTTALNWESADEESYELVRKTFLDASEEMRPNLVDFSLCESLNAHAMTMIFTPPFEISRQAYLGAIEGHEEAILKQNMTLTGKKPSKLDGLPAIWLFAEGKNIEVDMMMYNATLFVFSKKYIISVTINSFDSPIDESSEVSKSYLERIKLDSELEPGDILNDPINRDRTIGRIIGYILTPLLMFGLPIGIIVILLKLFGKRP